MESSAPSCVNRRTALRQLAVLTGATLLGGGAPTLRAQATKSPFNPQDEALLEEIERAAFRYFDENTHARTGLVKERSAANGTDNRQVASIAATGFGLTALCIADKRKYLTRAQARARVLTALRYLVAHMPQQRGFYYRRVDWQQGSRVQQAEVSAVDTATLLCGVLCCRSYFEDKDIEALASRLYERVEWPWMLNGAKTFAHGWTPERGFTAQRWDTYAEHMMLNLLAIGSPSRPVAPDTWDAWRRPQLDFRGERFIYSRSSLYIHQYSHAWFDFRGRTDRYTEYFQNSVRATRAHRDFCLGADVGSGFGFLENVWGVSASDSQEGYKDWGGPPAFGGMDGTIVPYATAGSLPFMPDETVAVQREMRRLYSNDIWRRYGFVDAFNTINGWTSPDVIGVDLGLTLLMAENARTSFVWETFMLNDDVGKGMAKAGFKIDFAPAVAPRRK